MNSNRQVLSDPAPRHGWGQWSKQEIALFITLLLLSVASKGLGLTRSFATDDYWFTDSSVLSNKAVYFSQGRIVSWLALAAIDAIGVNIVDCSFFFGITAMAVQAAFAVYAIRFIGAKSLSSACLCGALIILHPYNVEIFTYKIALPAYVLCMLLVIAVIEISRCAPFSIKGFVQATISASMAFLCYQIAINYLLAVAFCGMLAALLAKIQKDSDRTDRLVKSSLFLFICTLTSGAMHIVLLRSLRWIGIIDQASTRSMLIGVNDISKRYSQVAEALRNQYIGSEPLFGLPLKLLLLSIVGVALILILFKLCRAYRFVCVAPLGLAGVATLALSSIGIIVFFREWYPAPRVVSHTSVITGLLLLVCFNDAIPAKFDRAVRLVLSTSCITLIAGYSLLGNQVIADQIRLNFWDAMLANRLIGRIEALAGKDELTNIVIYGGAKSFQRELRTAYFDINTSAFSREMFAEAIVSEATGKKVQIRSTPPPSPKVCSAWWPQKGSIKVEGKTAFVCLAEDVIN